MHFLGAFTSLKASFATAVSRVQLSCSVGNSDSPLRLQVLPSATQTQDIDSKPAPQQASQQNSLSRHPEASAQINPGLPKTAKYALLRKDDIPHLRLSKLPEVILLCRPSLLSKLGEHFQLCSQGGSPHEQIPFCLDEVTNIEKDFALEIFDTVSPNCHAALHRAHELAPVDVAMHVNSLCTGNNGPEPCIEPLVLAGMSHDVPKVLGFFVQFQPLYLWELGQMVQWFIQYYSPRWYVAFDFLISVADHQRAFIVHICTQHLMMCIQDAEDWVACLSRAQLIHLCTGVPDLTPRPTEMAQILEPIRSSQSVSFVLPGGPVQPLHSSVNASHDPQQQAIPVAYDSNLLGSEQKTPTAHDAMPARWVANL